MHRKWEVVRNYLVYLMKWRVVGRSAFVKAYNTVNARRYGYDKEGDDNEQ